MRLIGRALMLIVAVVVAIWALKLVVFPAVILAVRLALLAAVVGGGVWAYRRISGGSRRRPLRGGGRVSDWDYIRGRVDRSTYVRSKSLPKGR